MKLKELLETKNEWFGKEGPSFGVVLSSRLRLARNLAKYRFTQRASKIELKQILEKARQALTGIPNLRNSIFFNLSRLDKIGRQFLMERHLISCELMESSRGCGVLIVPDKNVSIMVNEEDHLRIQWLASGLDLRSNWLNISQLDDYLSGKFDYAFSSELGYLTACPTNVGTGLRASCLLHLPGLVMTGRIEKIIHELNKLGVVTRGLYGEGTKVMGDLYQVSNATTLGKGEEEIIQEIEGVVKRIISYEDNARDSLYRDSLTGSLSGNYSINLGDQVYRAYGILSNAQLISFEETLNLLSKVRLGVCMKYALPCSLEKINRLMVSTQPAHLQLSTKGELSIFQRDRLRAEILRSSLKG